MTRPPWFGRLLDWHYDRHTEQHVAWHGGHTHYIAKVSRRHANDRRITPGWHLMVDDDGRGHDWGPPLGSTIDHAKMNAEAWIICPDRDMRDYPKLSIAFYSSGVHYEGLDIRRDDDNQRFTVAQRGEQVGSILPVFDGRGGGVRVRWRALPVQVRRDDIAATWAEAVHLLHAALTASTMTGQGPR
jgi:hypothetical protein